MSFYYISSFGTEDPRYFARYLSIFLQETAMRSITSSLDIYDFFISPYSFVVVSSMYN